MKLPLSLAVLAAPLALAACTPEAPPPEPPLASADPCGAARYSHLIGQTSPTITVPEGQMYRIAREDQPMTMEMIQDRLTFIVDNRGKLLSVSCS
ncbi:I78 family peptidase inhibitor [Paracoccus sp. PS-1]|uniref:I78 family peptidase inhibitor n=1 Tax=unclassified Paracoccus (in: a-proteobacteria) TaxID=2688777 RepID=UPI00048D7432|nr:MULTISPECIES: I78 family peptidase inhibitor [unclassified Paracoccus (in: a-proteobacteria)]MDQ7263317.1 I78 family peptidase inhibitor [Paracoccus sp. PS1]RQP07358.1 MAG: hypothetical protein D1H97_03100 [Paracoccus sp. BP8]UFM63379.1 hypothetical protein LOS78_04240 [Paracoccus sp. MA]